MRHYYKVISYDPKIDCHLVESNDTGERNNMDLCVDSNYKLDPLKLVGKTISIEYSYPFLSIAVNVKQENGG